jgi:hypothetical protein
MLLFEVITYMQFLYFIMHVFKTSLNFGNAVCRLWVNDFKKQYFSSVSGTIDIQLQNCDFIILFKICRTWLPLITRCEFVQCLMSSSFGFEPHCPWSPSNISVNTARSFRMNTVLYIVQGSWRHDLHMKADHTLDTMNVFINTCQCVITHLVHHL